MNHYINELIAGTVIMYAKLLQLMLRYDYSLSQAG